MRNLRFYFLLMLAVSAFFDLMAIDHPDIVISGKGINYFTLIDRNCPVPILIDDDENTAVRIATENLRKDFQRVCGNLPDMFDSTASDKAIIIGTLESPYIKEIMKRNKIDRTDLAGKTEKYIISTVSNPLDGISEALVIAGSDRRGTVYGIYELSEQIGVSPWYDWADVPVEKHENLSISKGVYSAGEPTVRYRGIFLNDEAPCLTGWVKNTYGTDYGGHEFYARVFELLLRLRANFMWPAMWGWSFYADDPANSKTADDMGIIIGTSHHEPMARNHQEWVRNRKEYGAWNYASNREVIDRFFREGIERAAHTEDLITIGMRGDGDAPMGGEEGNDHNYVSNDEYNIRLLREIFKNQRNIIREVTGQKAEKRPQVWAIYKEVQKYYDLGLRAPDDVILLLCDDNWGNIRKLPDAEERKHPGGWGMYYHVDYVGAPRNSKWLNVTPPQNLCEQMKLTYDYGVDRLWILNVGDLKPMEYPITLFLDMAWNPSEFNPSEIQSHLRDFCAQQFGENQADEAARILNLQSKYAGRVTPEMLDCGTYNLGTGEWKQVADEYARLEAEALRQYVSIKPEYRDTYRQLILFPVQAMANLYDMYYAQAMNHKLHSENNPMANIWAERVKKAFDRDAELCREYNEVMSNGKWKGMMTQKHIGYKSWNDDFPADTLPECRYVEDTSEGNYIFSEQNGVVAIEAEHYFDKTESDGLKWTVIPDMGRTLSGISLTPYDRPVNGASLRYRMNLSNPADSLDVRIILKSTLAFANPKGHSFAVAFDDRPETIVCFNKNLNEEPENVYTVFYPTVARRVIENKVRLPISRLSGSEPHTLTLTPLDPAVVFEKIVVDCGGYKDSYLFMQESPSVRQ